MIFEFLKIFINSKSRSDKQHEIAVNKRVHTILAVLTITEVLLCGKKLLKIFKKKIIPRSFSYS